MNTDFQPRPVYVFVGAERLLLEDAWEDLRVKLAPKVDFGIDFCRFHGEEHRSAEVLEALSAFPFASEYRVVLLEDAHSLTADEQKAVASYVASPSPSHVLVVLSHALGARTPLRIAAAAAKCLTALEPPTKPAEIVAFAKKELARMGGKADYSGLLLLAEWTGGDLLRLRNELNKLAIYADGREIGADDVRRVVAHGAQGEIFRFVDAVSEKKLGRALPLLRVLMDAGEPPLRVLAMVVRQVRLLIGARELIDEGRADEIKESLKVHSFVAGKIRQQAAGFSYPELSALFEIAVDTDKKIKSGQMAPDFALEDMLFRFMRPQWG